MIAIGPRATDSGTDEWWADLNAEILDCLAEGGAMAPADVGRRLGMSEGAAVSCLSMLAQEGKVRICLVERR
jgi:hypothetical protein